MYCFKCGGKLDDDSEFCIFCGQKLYSDSLTTVEGNTTLKPCEFSGLNSDAVDESSSKSSAVSGNIDGGTILQSSSVSNATRIPKPKTKILIPLFISVAVVGIMLAIVLLPRQPDPVETLQQTQAPTATPRIFAPVGTAIEGRLAAGSDYSLVLLDDGTVLCYGGMTTGVYDDVQNWEDIVWISGYDNHAVGIRQNGTLAVAGTNENGDLDVLDLSNVTQVVTGYQHTVALTVDGRVYFRGNPKHGRNTCEKWTNVRKLLGGDDHLAVIFNDGTMDAVGYNGDKQCDIESVSEVIGGAVSSGTTYVLRSDHTVYPYGKDWNGEDDVRGWSDIIFVDGGDEHTVGLQDNGKVRIAGSNNNFQYKVNDWVNIVAICTGQFHTIGIDMYGIIHITGLDGADYCSGDGDSIWQ